MKAACLFVFCCCVGGAVFVSAKPDLLLVTGAAGTEEYGSLFAEWGGDWEGAAEKAEARFHQVGPVPAAEEETVKDSLRALLAEQPKQGPEPLWLVFIGHGTFDGRTAKFNLVGPDLSASELGDWLEGFERPLVLLACFSSSAPFMKKPLAGKGRVVVTATRSGFEQNFCRFGGALAKAMDDPAADLDKDGQTSLLEAWLAASRSTAAFYAEEGRLATEHALLDDNGDAKGTQADWYKGINPVKTSAEKGLLPDGLRAHQLHLVPGENERALTPEQRRRRDALELDLARLRARKAELEEEDYFRRLETLLLDLGALYFPSDAASP